MFCQLAAITIYLSTVCFRIRILMTLLFISKMVLSIFTVKMCKIWKYIKPHFCRNLSKDVISLRHLMFACVWVVLLLMFFPQRHRNHWQWLLWIFPAVITFKRQLLLFYVKRGLTTNEKNQERQTSTFSHAFLRDLKQHQITATP